MRTLVLIKKEFLEIFRTSKIYVLPIVFLFIAISSPVLAKYTPDLLNMMIKYTGQQINIEIPPPYFIDSFVQLFKNIGQMGLLVVLFVFAGTMVDEKNKGTATLILTKGVSRSSFVASKFLGSTIFMTLVYVVTSGIFVIYTQILFPNTPWGRGIAALGMVWLYCEMVLAVVVLCSVVNKSYVTSAVFSLLTFLGFSILGTIPIIDKYTPGYMITLALNLFGNPLTFVDYAWPIGTTLGVIILSVAYALFSFKRQEF